RTRRSRPNMNRMWRRHPDPGRLSPPPAGPLEIRARTRVANAVKPLTLARLMKRTATAVWNGSLKEGKGTLTAPGGALKNTPYSFAMRFADAPGTNPEELIDASHAGV